MVPEPICEAASTEETDVEHRTRVRELPPDESDEEPYTDEQRNDDRRREPASLGTFDDPVEERDETGHDQHDTERVEGRVVGVLRVRQQHQASTECERDDRDVDRKRGAPIEVLEQPARADRAQHATEPGERRPDRDRSSPLVVREDVREDRQGARHDERRAGTHDRTARDELPGRGGEHRDDRPAAENDESELQRSLAAIAIRERARGEQ